MYTKVIPLITFCLLSCHLPAQLLEEHRVLYLKFDGNTLDDSSDNRHDVINHDASFGVGFLNEGLRLDGNGQYLEIRHSSDLEVPDQVTMSVMYRHEEQADTDFYSLVEQSADEFGGHSRYGTWIFQNNRIMMCIEPDVCPGGSGLCQRCTTSDTTLTPGNWYHIVTSYDGTAQRIYICLLYTSPSPRDQRGSRMPSSA